MDEKTSLLSSSSRARKESDHGATRRRSRLGSFSRFGGEFAKEVDAHHTIFLLTLLYATMQPSALLTMHR